ncbi:MAG TPA: hypothetical protein PKV27_13435, partial [Ilumatobacteraceae bacterium]|nr:hypothetical protein [Ilumatobacteraceae bacterium]
SLPVVLDDSGLIDVKQSVAGVPALVAAGATDLRIRPLATDTPAAAERLRQFVDAFRAAAA